MAKVVRDKEMSVSQDALFQAITDFSSYPEFLSEVVGAEVESLGEGKSLVHFELDLVKRFRYTLEFQTEGKESVRWKLKDSDFFKTNAGAWQLSSLGDKKTQVHYELDVGFGFFVPKFIAKKLTEVNLPKMFEAFEERAKSL